MWQGVYRADKVYCFDFISVLQNTLRKNCIILTYYTQPYKQGLCHSAGAAGISAYCASKHAVRGFMDSLRLEVCAFTVHLAPELCFVLHRCLTQSAAVEYNLTYEIESRLTVRCNQ